MQSLNGLRAMVDFGSSNVLNFYDNISMSFVSGG